MNKHCFLFTFILCCHNDLSLADTDRFLGPRDKHNLSTAIEDYIKRNDSVFQYGYWYGENWWRTKTTEQINKLPIDSLDAIAQRHDFAYQIAEQQGKIYGAFQEKRLKTIADYFAVRDANALPENPKTWVLPPSDVNKAARYRDRMMTGFNNPIEDTTIAAQQLSDWTTSPLEQWESNKTQQLSANDLEEHINALQKDWNNTHFPPLAKPTNTTVTDVQNNTQKLKNDPDYIELMNLSREMMQLTHSVMEQANAGKKPDNNTLNKIKTLEHRIAALNKRIETNYTKKTNDSLHHQDVTK